jgi:hypothetical protein
MWNKYSLLVVLVITGFMGIMLMGASPPDSPVIPPRSDLTPPPFALDNFIKGVSWVGGRREVPDDAVPNTKAHGVEWMALTPFGWMENQFSTSIRMNRRARPWGEADVGLQVTTQKAHAQGLKIMLKPHIWISRPIDNGWRGEIGFLTEEDWQTWESSYRTFILHYARLAEEEGIEILCLATELTKAVQMRPEFWKSLAREIRSLYSGEITYAANWYQDYDLTDIWTELDYIGVNAYFPLTQAANPSVEEIVEGWQPHLERIGHLSELYDKPVLFTEIGYKNTRMTTVKPWEWPRRMEGAILDEAEQANAYEALFRSVGALSWFRGVFIWDWYPNPDRMSADRITFSPQNKKGAEVLRKWYTFVEKGN